MNELLQKLADDFFQNSLDSSPTSAIMRGYKEYFDKIEELTEERFNSEKRICRVISIQTRSNQF